MHNSSEAHSKLFETIFSEIDANIDRSINPSIDFPYEKVLIQNQLAVLETVLLTKDSKCAVLEIGSGFGQVPPFFSHLGHYAVGGDLYSTNVLHTIWRILSVEHGCNFVKFDGMHLPFKRGIFDIVIFLGVLEYIGLENRDSQQEEDLHFLREIYHVLKANGSLLMSVPNRYSFIKFPGRLRTISLGFTHKEVCRLLSFSGFKLVTAWRDNFLPFRVRRVSPVLERITSKLSKMYLLLDTALSRTLLGVISTNLHYIFSKNPEST